MRALLLCVLPLCVLPLCALTLGGCASRHVESGLASWYGPGYAGKTTASGETFRPWRRTAAHRSLAFGSVVRVTRPDTGRSVRVVITDRGPFVEGRIIDLSRRSARRLDMIDAGVVEVELRIVGCRKSTKRSACD